MAPRSGRMLARRAQRGFGVGAENAQRQGIFEDRGAIDQLMGGAQARGAQRGATWLARLHRQILGGWSHAVHAWLERD